MKNAAIILVVISIVGISCGNAYADQVLVVISKHVRLFTGVPSGTYIPGGVLEKGEKVYLLEERKDGWIMIKTIPGITGWAKKKHFSPEFEKRPVEPKVIQPKTPSEIKKDLKKEENSQTVIQPPQVILHVYEKNPRHAYNLALWPIFGPIASAAYAGSSYLSIDTPSHLSATAAIFCAVNIIEIGLGAGIGYASAEDPKNKSDTPTTEEWIGLGGGIGVGLIVSTLTNVIAGRSFARSCIQYNWELYEKFKWSPPSVSFRRDGTTSVLMAFEF